MPSTTAITGGEINFALGGDNGIGGRRIGVIRERVTGVGSSGYLQLVQQLPANSKIVWATLNNRNAITPRIASTAAQTTAGQLGVAIIIGTALPAAATSGVLSTSGNVLLGQVQTAAAGSIAANSVAKGLAIPAATGGGIPATTYNVATTVAQNIYVLPFLSTTAATATGSFYVNTTASTGTSQYTLNGTGTATSGTTTADFDVQIFFDQYGDTPSA